MKNSKTERLRKIQQKVDTSVPLSKAQLLHLLREANEVLQNQRTHIRSLEEDNRRLRSPSGIILLDTKR